MPMNNGNVTRDAIGVAQGTFDANFNANESLAVLGMFSGQARDRGTGEGGGQGQAGTGTGGDRGKEKAPGEMPGAVSGAGELRRRGPGPWSL
jgi:hypothetical protein